MARPGPIPAWTSDAFGAECSRSCGTGTGLLGTESILWSGMPASLPTVSLRGGARASQVSLSWGGGEACLPQGSNRPWAQRAEPSFPAREGRDSYRALKAIPAPLPASGDTSSVNRQGTTIPHPARSGQQGRQCAVGKETHPVRAGSHQRLLKIAFPPHRSTSNRSLRMNHRRP